jgi:hypothetical protein
MKKAIAIVPVLVLLSAGIAQAGTYEVLACDLAPGAANNSWRPEVTHGGMLTFSACPSLADPRRGLGARNNYYPSGYTVPTGAAARWWFDSPPSTFVVGIRANAIFEQKNQRWQAGLSNGSQMIQGCGANPAGAASNCTVTMSAGSQLSLPSSSSLYTEAYCAFGPCPVGGGSYYVWASLTSVAVTVFDGTLPNVSNPRGDLWSDGWMKGTRRVTFDASDNTGIKDVRALVGGREMARAGRICDSTAKTCPDWPEATLDVNVGTLSDGIHDLTIEAVDRGGNDAALRRKIRVDNNPPVAPADLQVVGGEAWRSRNSFSISWSNPPQDAAPIAAAEYRMCKPTGEACWSGVATASNIERIADLQAPAPGEWILSLWLRDEAGNSDPETARSVRVRFDPEPPALAIRPQSAEDPARVSVEAADAISRLERAEIEVRRQGTDSWRTVPATLDAGGFSAVVDDEYLPDGVYDLRARGWDAAGNERSTTRRASGEEAKIILPLRVKTAMRVGKRQTSRARGARRARRVMYIRRPLVGQGRRIRIRGHLTAPGGNPLADVDVEVSARPAVSGSAFQPVATLRTSRSGRFAYLVPAGPSRVLRFRYPGAAKIRPQTREVHIRVRGASSIRASRRRVVNGESVTFSGRLRGGFVPPGGKLVELQFFDRGKWRTFRTFRAAASEGRWSYTYRFDGTRGTRTYRFRLRIPKENGYPFSPGASRAARVTVRGL